MSFSALPTGRSVVLVALALVAALLLLVACSPVASLNALAPRDTYRPTTDVAYGALARQRLDVYTPVTAAPAAGWPVVVFFYGGSWTSGARADYRFVGEALAAQGVLTLVADYRIHPEARYPVFLEDSAMALAWGLEHARALGGDPKRVFAMGHSAGGYNAAMLALDPSRLAAVGHTPSELAGWIGLAGAYDFLPLDADSPAKPAFSDATYPPGTQPIDHARPGSPKAFLAAPVHDKVVSPERSTLALAAKLQRAGVPVELHRVERVSHALLLGVFARPLRDLAPVLAQVVAFVGAA